jgi:metallophosphoesterase superfamily enzyme
MPCTEAPPPRLEIQPDVWLDARLALWLAGCRALVVADLHWGYVESHRAQGNLLPAWGDAEIAARLRALVADYQPRELIWLGDSLHTLSGRRAAEAYLAGSGVPVTVIAGNHDVRWNRAQGTTVVSRDGFLLHHGDQHPENPHRAVEIVGHLHPAVVWHDGAGTRLKLPALVAAPGRLVLPAFSPWAAGAPWKLGVAGETVYAIGQKRIFTVSPAPGQKQPLTR